MPPHLYALTFYSSRGSVTVYVTTRSRLNSTVINSGANNTITMSIADQKKLVQAYKTALKTSSSSIISSINSNRFVQYEISNTVIAFNSMNIEYNSNQMNFDSKQVYIEFDLSNEVIKSNTFITNNSTIQIYEQQLW